MQITTYYLPIARALVPSSLEVWKMTHAIAALLYNVLGTLSNLRVYRIGWGMQWSAD